MPDVDELPPPVRIDGTWLPGPVAKGNGCLGSVPCGIVSMVPDSREKPSREDHGSIGDSSKFFLEGLYDLRGDSGQRLAKIIGPHP